jgi:hypothetical protein
MFGWVSSRRFLIASLSVVGALAGLAVPAAASPPARATGAFTTQVVSQDVFRDLNNVLFVHEVDTDTYTGGLVGAATDTYSSRAVFGNDSGGGHGTEVCDSCTIGGRTGSYTAVFNFTVPPGFGPFTGTETFISGTGGLAGLHGGGSFQSNGTVNTYSYSYHFDP